MAHLKILVLLLAILFCVVGYSYTKDLKLNRDQKVWNNSCSEKVNIEKCLEEELIQYLDKILNTTSIILIDGIDFVKTSEMNQTINESASKNFSDVLWDKLSLLTSTRSIRIHLADYSEGRGKKAKKQYIAIGLLISAILAALKFQALSFFVGKAFMISKMAFLAAGFLAFKLLLPTFSTKSARNAAVYVEPSVDLHFDYIPPIRD